MDGERVAGVERVDVAVSDQVLEVRPRTGVDDRRAADEQHPFPRPQHREQLARDLAEQGVARLLARDGARHELEDGLAPSALRDRELHAAMADHDRVAGFDVGGRDGQRAAVVDDDRAVHLGIGDRQPGAVDPHLGRVIGGRVELVGEDAVGRRRLDQRVAFLEHFGALLAQLVDEIVEIRFIGGFDREARVRRIGLGPPRVELFDHVLRAFVVGQDAQDAVEDPGVEDMPAQLDPADDRRGRRSGCHGPRVRTDAARQPPRRHAARDRHPARRGADRRRGLAGRAPAAERAGDRLERDLDLPRAQRARDDGGDPAARAQRSSSAPRARRSRSSATPGRPESATRAPS